MGTFQTQACNASKTLCGYSLSESIQIEDHTTWSTTLGRSIFDVSLVVSLGSKDNKENNSQKSNQSLRGY